MSLSSTKWVLPKGFLYSVLRAGTAGGLLGFPRDPPSDSLSLRSPVPTASGAKLKILKLKILKLKVPSQRSQTKDHELKLVLKLRPKIPKLNILKRKITS